MFHSRLLYSVAAVAGVAVLASILIGLLPFGSVFNPVAFDTGHLPETPIKGEKVEHKEWELVGGAIEHPEDIVSDQNGTLYVGVIGGHILKRENDESEWTLFAETGGRPLGLFLDRDGSLLVANHGVGIQRVSAEGAVSLVADSVGGTPIALPNGVVADSEGVIYVTDSSTKYNVSTLGVQPTYALPDLLEGRPFGRVIRIDPASGAAEVIADGLYFPNSLVIAPDGNALILGESSRYRLTRVWIRGPRQGSVEHVIAALPGNPDGLDYDDQGRLMLALYDHVPLLNRHILPNTWARRILMSLPRSWFVNDDLSGFVAIIDPKTWEILQMIRNVDAEGFTPSNVVQVGNRLYAGTLVGNSVAVTPYP